MLAAREAAHGLRIYHVEHPTPKHVENSHRGIMHAAHDPHLNAIDLDGLITKADPRCPLCPPGTCRGHLVGCHWRTPMIHDGFHDPAGLMPRHKQIDDMTVTEALRLEAHTNGHVYHMSLLPDLVAHCGRVGVIAVVEPKPDPRWLLDWPWQQLEAAAHANGTDLRARALRNLPHPGAGVRRVQAARRNGVPAWVI